MLVPKVWGFEDIVVNESYCGKRMYVKDQHRCSIHMHAIKDEVLMVGHEGLLWFEKGPSPDQLSGFWMQENDRIRILPNLWHRFTALRDTIIWEFSTHSEDSDSIRSVQGGKIGDDEYRALLSSFVRANAKARVIEVEEAKAISAAAKAEGKLVGMCNGCFDLMHLGHAELLMQAKQRCEVLFVCMNDDKSVRKMKGEKRPFVDEIGRSGMLASNRNVDYVVVVRDTNCLGSVEAIKPDVYVTTAEYGTNGTEGREAVRLGARIEVIQMLPGYNTTRLSAKVQK